MPDITCPKCKSESVKFLEKAQTYYCTKCENEFGSEYANRQEKPAKSLRIFLSYGHDRNEELVHRIKVDLEALGHDVWIDRSEIKFGDHWRRTITDGITGSDWMFSFLSKYSTREPGVCLDELAIALGAKSGIVQTILVESEKEVVAPVTVSHIQWLDMHDWSERKESGGEEFEAWYQQKFQEISRCIKSEANLRFAGEIQYLKDKLKPVTMDAFTAGLLRQGFVGRQWLVEEIRQWLQTQNGERAFILTGEPGIGKSAFSAWLTHYNKADILAAVFIRYNQPSASEPERILRSLAFQLAARLPDYRKLLTGLPELDALDKKNADELFTYLLTEPLRICIDGSRTAGLILIDALDESQQRGAAGVADLLARHVGELPSWVRIIATTRPEAEVMSTLAHLRPRKLDADDARNRQDIRDFFQRELEKHNPAQETIETIVARSEGIFLYAKYVCEEIKAKRLFLDRLDEFPKGLGGIYTQFFKRQFPDTNAYLKETAPALQALLAAVETLQRTDLEGVMGWGDTEAHHFLLSLGSLFTTINEKIEPFHRSLTDWLTRRDDAGVYYVSRSDGHKRLAVTGLKYAEPLLARKELNPMMNYSTKYAGVHLYASDMEVELIFIVRGAAEMIRDGAPEYAEILGNLFDWVVRKEEFKQEKTLKNIIVELPENTVSNDLALLFRKKASTYERTGDTLWALLLYEAALKNMEVLIERAPERSDFQWGISVSCNYIGGIYGVLGESDKALEYYMRGLKNMEVLIEREPERTDFQREISVFCNYIGGIYTVLGESDKALEYYMRDLKNMEALIEREPERTDFQREISISCDNVGRIYKALGEGGKALEYYVRDLKNMEALIEREPERTDFQRDISFSCNNVGRIYETLGEGGKALEYYVRGLKIREALIEQEPERTDFQYEASVSCSYVGGRYQALGKDHKALEYHRRGLKIMEALTEREPERTDFQRETSILYDNVGFTYKAIGKSGKALEYCMRGYKIMEALTEREPERTDYQHGISVCCNNVGFIYKALGESNKAFEYYMRGLKIMEALIEQEPERTDFQRDISTFFNNIGGIYEALGESNKAFEYYMRDLKNMEVLIEREPERTDLRVALATSCWNIRSLLPAEERNQYTRLVSEIVRALKEKGAVHGQLEQLWALLKDKVR